MDIRLSNLGKKFNRDWLFRDLSLTFQSGKSYALTGPNGSGKSTLIQIIAGNQIPSSGKVTYHLDDKTVAAEDIFSSIAISAPYLELIEEFTLEESLEFHFKFKQLRSGYSLDDLINLADFDRARGKFVKNFSSGMKQRLKLLLAFYSVTPILLLDEPTTNLDEDGINWYLHQVVHRQDNLLLIASNQLREYSFTDSIISLEEYKG
jgi:ABC-type multidrug transport system ATPase subunit